MSGPGREPPRLAEAWLRRALPDDVRGRSILGDAREEFARRVERGGPTPGLWYWLHAIRVGATYAVPRLIGRLTAAHEKTRGDVMGNVWRDLRFAGRSIARTPGSASISVLVLGFGIGLCAFMFSVIYGVYFRDLDVDDGARLRLVNAVDPAQPGGLRLVRLHDYVDLAERQTAFADLGAYYGGTVHLVGEGAPTRYDGAYMTAGALEALRVRPILGRLFDATAEEPGVPPQVLLGFDVWREDFGSSPDVIGSEVRVNGRSGTVVGVMPEGFRYPIAQQIWMPMQLDADAVPRGAGVGLWVLGRLAGDVTDERALAELQSVGRQIGDAYPEDAEDVGFRVQTLIEANTGPSLDLIFGAMMAAVLSVLLVACANVANLLLSRAALRSREVGLRTALGGSRWSVMAPFFAEAAVLAGLGALVGTGIAWGMISWFDAVTAPARTGRPYFMAFELDLPILAFTVALATATALVAGVAPALKASRADAQVMLADRSRGSSGLRIGRLSKALVIVEVALSVALLVGAGLMTKGIVRLSAVEYPYDADRLFTARVGLFDAVYPNPDDRAAFFADLRERLEDRPEIVRAGLATALPMDGTGARPIALEGVAYERPQDRPWAWENHVSEGYFDALGLSLVAGRDFRSDDIAANDPVAIVNQPFVERFFPDGSALGRSFRVGAPADTLVTIVGVAPDLQEQRFAPQGTPGSTPAAFYRPIRQTGPLAASIVAAPRSGDPLSLTADVRAALRELDPDLAIHDVRTQRTVIDEAGWFYGVFGTVFVIFGVSALLMSSVGLYGVLAFAVTRRRREMGIRMALGAQARDVIRLVMRQAATQIGAGAAIGLALAWATSRGLAFLIFQVDPRDPIVYGGVVLLLAAVGALAGFVPARRATSVDPSLSLRAE